MTFVMRTAFCSNTHVHKHFVEPTASPPDEPKKVRNSAFCVETWRKEEYGTDLFSKPTSIEIQVVRLDRFCCPIALTILVKNLLKG